MPSRLQTKEVNAVGGLIQTFNVLSIPAGSLISSVNFEPSLIGGYRRINGFTKFDTTEVPGTGKTLGVKVFNDGVLAAREHASSGNTEIFFSTGSGWGSKINTDTRSTQGKHRFWTYNWTGTENILGCDGGQNAFRYDGTTYTLLNGTGAPADPKFVTEYKEHIFFAGYSANKGEITFSAPSDETNYLTINGAGNIVIGDEITGLHGFRDQLIILCKNSLYKLTGDNLFNYKLLPITENIGCIVEDTIQEIGGDLMFLGPDGVRTIAGTERIGDIEIASLTRNIQDTLTDVLNAKPDDISSVVVREKNQYRLFYPTSTGTAAVSQGIIGALRKIPPSPGVSASLIWEWGELLGFKPYVCDSGIISDEEYVIHGNYDDGFIMRQEKGNNLDTANVNAVCTFADDDIGDAGVRKVFHKIRIFYKPEGTIAITAKIILDYNDENTAQPAVFDITSGGSLDKYGTAVYGTAKYGSAVGQIQKQDTDGSAFAIGLRIASDDTKEPYSIQGYLVEYAEAARR